MDGGPPENYPDEFAYKGMRVLFTPGVQADERIKERIEYLKNRRDVTVVTNDKELLNYALRYDLVRLPCYKLVSGNRKLPSTEKPRGLSAAEKENINRGLPDKWKK